MSKGKNNFRSIFVNSRQILRLDHTVDLINNRGDWVDLSCLPVVSSIHYNFLYFVYEIKTNVP